MALRKILGPAVRAIVPWSAAQGSTVARGVGFHALFLFCAKAQLYIADSLLKIYFTSILLTLCSGRIQISVSSKNAAVNVEEMLTENAPPVKHGWGQTKVVDVLKAKVNIISLCSRLVLLQNFASLPYPETLIFAKRRHAFSCRLIGAPGFGVRRMTWSSKQSKRWSNLPFFSIGLDDLINSCRIETEVRCAFLR